jgi:hypothetical protein
MEDPTDRPTMHIPRVWLVSGTSKASGFPASVRVTAARDVLTIAARENPWFCPTHARTVRTP